MFEDQWDKPVKLHSPLDPSLRPRAGHRYSIHFNAWRDTSDRQSRPPSPFLPQRSNAKIIATAPSNYSPPSFNRVLLLTTPIAVARTLLTKIQIFNTAASTMRAFAAGLGEVLVWRWV